MSHAGSCLENGPSTEPPEAACGHPAALSALCSVLLELRDFIEALNDERYVAREPGQSAIGSHVRHCLDHAAALISGLDRGVIDYDARRRGTSIEYSRSAASRLTAELAVKLTRVTDTMLDAAVTVQSMVTAGGPAIRTRSTFGRELVFVLSHTIHHNAMIAALARHLGVAVPERFGFAPSTVAFLRDGQPCTPSTP